MKLIPIDISDKNKAIVYTSF